MASNIVPGNIDGTFPVAGKDNSSQGFRDNFSATKTNFTNAKSEIESLQNNSVQTNQASNFNDNVISRAVLKETAETNRYLRTLFQKVARNAPLELFGSLIITTGHDFSYAGSGVTYKALPPNQGGDGVPDPNKEITEIAGGRVFFTSGNELGDFRIGGGLVIKQASGTLEGRTFSKSLFSLVTPFSLALQD